MQRPCRQKERHWNALLAEKRNFKKGLASGSVCYSYMGAIYKAKLTRQSALDKRLAQERPQSPRAFLAGGHHVHARVQTGPFWKATLYGGHWSRVHTFCSSGQVISKLWGKLGDRIILPRRSPASGGK